MPVWHVGQLGRTSSLREVVIKLLMVLSVLALNCESDSEADDENTNVEPENAAHVEGVFALAGDELGLAWVVAWEEESP